MSRHLFETRPVAGRRSHHFHDKEYLTMQPFTHLHRLARPSRRTLRVATLFVLIGMLSGLLAPFGAVPGIAPVIHAQVIQGNASTLVPTGARDYTLAGSKIFWRAATDCPISPTNVNVAPEIITRVATYGSQSRQLLNRIDPHGPNACNPYKIVSNIIADD